MNELDTLDGTPQAPPPQPPPQQPQQPQGPTNELGDSMPQGPQQMPLMQGPNPSDIENYAAAVHHSRLANAMNAVANILGGSQTLRLVKNPDGSVDMQQVDSSPGEKWGRVAKAALSGAATGFAVGQGPGGAQRAAAASIQQGMAQPGADRDKTLALADTMNNQNRQRLMFNANMAKMHQDLVKSTFDNMAAPIRFNTEQTAANLAIHKTLTDMGATTEATYDTPDNLAAQVNTNPKIVDGHLGTDGMSHPVDNIKDGYVVGGTIYHLPEDQRHQLNETAVDLPFTKVDEKGKVSTTYMHVPAHMMEKQNIMAGFADSQKQSNEASKQSSAMTVAQEDADTKKQQARGEAGLQGAQAGEANARTALLGSQKELVDRQLSNSPGGIPRPVENPNLPPPANFDPETPGIAPLPKSGGYKVPAAITTKAEQALVAKHNAAIMTEILNRKGSQILGTFNGAPATILKNLIGNQNDPDLAAFGKALDNYSTALGTIHGTRNYQNKDDALEGVINHFKTGKKPALAAINEDVSSAQQFIDANDNFQTYGTLQGPSAEARAKAAAKYTNYQQSLQAVPGQTPPAQPTPGAQPAPGGNASQAARAIPPIPPGHTAKANYVLGSDQKYYWIEPGNMAAAQAADPKLQVIPRQ